MLSRVRGPNPDWSEIQWRVGRLFEPHLPGGRLGGGGGGWGAVRTAGSKLRQELLKMQASGIGDIPAPLPASQFRLVSQTRI